MSRFTDAQFRFTARTILGRCEYDLTKPLVYEIDFLGSGWKITAPIGFRTDGPSVPGFIAWALPVGKMARSAVVHDQMRNDPRRSKLLGDYVFLEAMGVEGVPVVWRVLAFLAVLVNFRR